MPSFDIVTSLKILTPGMMVRGALYRYRRAYHVLRSTQPRLSGWAFWQAVWKEANRPVQPEQPPVEAFGENGMVTQVTTTGSTVAVGHEGGQSTRLSVLADNLLQIRVRDDGTFPEPFSYSIAKDQWNPPDCVIEQSDEAIQLSTGAFTMSLDRQSGYFTIANAKGHILLAETHTASYLPDGWLHWEAQIDPDAAVYGLGMKAFAFNLAGGSYELWNIDPAGYDRGTDPINLSVPFITILTENGALGLFFDNSYRAWVDLGADERGNISYRAMGGEFRLYVMTGTPEHIIRRYTELTGRHQLPPLWALGFHQSRWSYYPETRVREIAHEFRSRRLPCDVIHLDIHYMDGFRCFTWDKDRFPDPSQMNADLRDQGFKMLSIIDPGIKVDKNYWVYQAGIKQDAFVKYPTGTIFTGPVWPEDCHFPDYTDPDVREWWGNLYKGLLDDGLVAFWNDMNEFALITLTPMEDNYAPDELVHVGDGTPTTHAEIHNVYGLLMVRASTEGLQRLQPDKRPVMLTRAGWAGIQRYSMHWTADNGSSWDHLHLSIQMILNLGFSGIAITGPDVGGFSGEPDGELIARWMMVGAFMPFYRNHAMAYTPAQEPWAFGPEVEAISRKALEMRYRLLPYIYTSIWQAVQWGLPVARSMSFMHPDEPHLYSVDDQFFFGDSMLVAPIIEEGAVQREVYLPQGIWYDYESGACFEGGQTIRVDAPVDVLPVFVKEGAVIPHWPVQQYVGEKQIEAITLHVYATDSKQESLFYQDDGETVHYEQSDYHRLSHFTVRNDTLLCRIEGGYIPPTSRFIAHCFGFGAVGDASIVGGEIIELKTSDDHVVVMFDAPADFTLTLNTR